MSDQSEFAQLLFGPVPELPSDLSDGLLDQTFAAASDPSFDATSFDHTASLLPDLGDVPIDDGDLPAADDDGTWSDDPSHSDADPGGGHDPIDHHLDAGLDHHGLDHDELGHGFDHDGLDQDEFGHGGDWGGDAG